jgi:hypothetical protein
MRLTKVIPVVIAGAALLLAHATTARAGILATDPNALAGFRGTQPFAFAMPPFSFNATVDYAVYAPGQFQQTFGAGSDPSGGTRFVYAYQMFNTGTAQQLLPRELSVGFNGNQNPANIGFLPDAFGNFGIDPTTSTFIPAAPPFTSAIWNRTNWLPAGAASEILLFTAPNGPGFFNSSVRAGALVDERTLPSPIPEPATLGAAAVALLLSVTRRR